MEEKNIEKDLIDFLLKKHPYPNDIFVREGREARIGYEACISHVKEFFDMHKEEKKETLREFLLKKSVPVQETPRSRGIRRRIKNTKFSDVETEQIKRMYNSMKAEGQSNSTIISKIGNTMKLPYRRVYNKIYWMGISKIIDYKPTKHKISMTDGRRGKKSWTPENEKQLVELYNKNIKNQEISTAIGRTINAVDNKLVRLRKEGKL